MHIDKNLFDVVPKVKFKSTGNDFSKPSGNHIISLGEIPTTTPETETAINFDSKKDDLYRCVRPVLSFGRIVGVVPLSGLFEGKLQSVSFGKTSFASLTTITFSIIIFINLLFGLNPLLASGPRDASGTARKAGSFVYYAMGFYLYMFMYRNSSHLVECLRKWRKVKTTFSKEDDNLSRHVLLICGIALSGILENIFFHFQLMKGAFSTGNKHVTFSSFWEYYYSHVYEQPGSIIPFNAFLAMVLFAANKLVLYSWNFADILITVIARAIYKRFELHWRAFEESTAEREKDKLIWIVGIRDHEILIDLLNHFKNLLSPLIFACIAANVYYLGLETYRFIAMESPGDTINRLREFWSFLNLIVRTFCLVLSCSRVNTHVHKFQFVLAKCPVSALTVEVVQAEFRLRTSTIGFDGLNCFVITNSFGLSVFSAVFALEIVFLQSSSVN